MGHYQFRAAYPSFGAKRNSRLPRWLLIALLAGSGSAAAYFGWISTHATQENTAAPQPDSNGRITLPLALPAVDPKLEQAPPVKPDTADNITPLELAEEEVPLADKNNPLRAIPEKSMAPSPEQPEQSWHTLTFTAGDQFERLLTKMQVNRQSLYAVLALKPAKDRLNQLKPGDTLELQLDGKKNISSLRVPLGPLQTLVITREEIQQQKKKKSRPISYQAVVEPRKTDIQTSYVTVTINRSLYADGEKAGLSQPLLQSLLTIFGWDIDFARELQKGDSFTLIYETHYDEQGEKIADGEILAAEFINKKVAYRTVRYTNRLGQTDYYDLQGRPMHKTFLRTPVNYSRISSHFDPQRLHPILNTIRAHKGVDYAAPTGTPVYATADGTVEFQGSQNGYGKTIILKHGDRYSTLYAHLSAFASNLGQTVTQGQIIGFVGQTGSATGPHLHYEFRIDGIHQDPLTVKLPQSGLLVGEEKQAFINAIRHLALQMRLLRNTTKDKTTLVVATQD